EKEALHSLCPCISRSGLASRAADHGIMTKLRLPDLRPLPRSDLAVGSGPGLDPGKIGTAAPDCDALPERDLPDLAVVAVDRRLLVHAGFGARGGKSTDCEGGGDGGGKKKRFHRSVLLI